MNTVIRTENLTKYYGKHRGIIDLNLAVEKGDIFGFIGPNGAGKSTTIRILLGLISADSGHGEMLGQDVGTKNREYLKNVGYMPSEAMFYGRMKVRDIIALSAGLRKKDCSAAAKSLCERLNLDTGRRIDELSLGNRKKVAIVCAMQHDPELYVFDEPTSGLDPLIQKEFFDLIEEKKRSGATVFLSSHVLSEIQHHCNRAAIIREGKLIACDKVEALTKTTARRVTIHGISRLPEGMEGKSVSTGDNVVSFLYQGDIKKLLYQLESLPMDDLTITEPELEEVFLHYYQGEGKEE
ncbi:MAG: ABC transporter ATP-binding protein [Coprococcus sp.]